MKIDGRSVLHAVDKVIKLSPARFLHGKSNNEPWDTFTKIWENFYAGRQDSMGKDHGHQFSSIE